MEKDSIRINTESEFHMLRHFSGHQETYINYFTSLGKSVFEIEKELNEVGSRFFPDFATNLEQIIDHLFSVGFIELLGVNGNKILKCSVSKDYFPNGVGSQSVVPVNSLSPVQREQIFYKENRGIKLKHLKVDEMPSTSEFCVILKPYKSEYIFITSFPGGQAMPLPKYEMDKLLYEECKSFWETHVFLIERQSSNFKF
jgi:hypothetical protein